jgi:hypothetical protein
MPVHVTCSCVAHTCARLQVVATDPTLIMEDQSRPKRSSDICAWVNIIYGELQALATAVGARAAARAPCVLCHCCHCMHSVSFGVDEYSVVIAQLFCVAPLPAAVARRLQRALHVLRGAGHAGRGAEPAAREHPCRGGGAGAAGLPRDHSARPEHCALTLCTLHRRMDSTFCHASVPYTTMLVFCVLIGHLL